MSIDVKPEQRVVLSSETLKGEALELTLDFEVTEHGCSDMIRISNLMPDGTRHVYLIGHKEAVVPIHQAIQTLIRAAVFARELFGLKQQTGVAS